MFILPEALFVRGASWNFINFAPLLRCLRLSRGLSEELCCGQSRCLVHCHRTFLQHGFLGVGGTKEFRKSFHDSHIVSVQKLLSKHLNVGVTSHMITRMTICWCSPMATSYGHEVASAGAWHLKADDHHLSLYRSAVLISSPLDLFFPFVPSRWHHASNET